MDTVRFEREASVASLVFDNAPRHSLTTRMLAELGRHVEAVEADADIRAVVIRGASPQGYTVGADIREMDDRSRLSDRSAQTRRWLQQIHEVLLSIERSTKVFVCAMKGVSYGAGIETAAACDIRVADSTARFAMPEVKLGVMPGYGGTQRLTRLMGMGHTLAFVLSAQEIDADTAQRWGLVDMVTAAGDAEATAMQLARAIAGCAPLGLASAKAAIRRGLDLDLLDGLAAERESFVRCALSSDFDEGRRAFIEKRPPQFVGH
jgi:enoyl-CoA hydratase